jgi:hypothetical protein
MDASLFFLEWHTRELLEAARGTARREALVRSHAAPRPRLAADIMARARRRFRRGRLTVADAKPTAARA